MIFCAVGELSHESLALMSGGGSSLSYYDLTTNPLLLQLAIGTASLLVLVVIVTFCCCIEIRRPVIIQQPSCSFLLSARTSPGLNGKTNPNANNSHVAECRRNLCQQTLVAKNKLR